ncbi:MAG: aspartate kinase [Bacteroidales bacterium]|jgi:aspartate kinase|nr:aspartate kinase [Bacteroidales bacterium]
MRVFKFGGASVKDPAGVRNVASIIRDHGDKSLVVVVSAMAKTTNALEKLTQYYIEGQTDAMMKVFGEVRQFHLDITNELFNDPKHSAHFHVKQTFFHLQRYIEEKPSGNYNYEYDRIVSTGEIVSTQIVSYYLNHEGVRNQWFDARKLIITDSSFRDARIDWILTPQAVKKALLPYLKPAENSAKPGIVLTQGFIGATTQGFTTTLGREGSDFSAAILAYSLQASEVVVWKDVPGLLNADPKLFEQTLLMPNISYQEAIELSYYGATVIHPKTLKPLLSRNIPLKVKSFFQPAEPGTIINEVSEHDGLVPSFIFKFNQVLVSIFPKDFSFIAEHNLSRIFSDFAKHGVKINLMQNSAISFSVCFDSDLIKTPALLRDLEKNFNVKYNYDLELITIRHYEKAQMEQLIAHHEVLLEQKSRITLQMVVRKKQ